MQAGENIFSVLVETNLLSSTRTKNIISCSVTKNVLMKKKWFCVEYPSKKFWNDIEIITLQHWAFHLIFCFSVKRLPLSNYKSWNCSKLFTPMSSLKLIFFYLTSEEKNSNIFDQLVVGNFHYKKFIFICTSALW